MSGAWENNGFVGGDPDDPPTVSCSSGGPVRHFSPVMRLHGDRIPNYPTFSADMTGGSNEVWSYGEPAFGILRDHLMLRERLRPYLTRLSEDAHRTGAPPMRPLFFDFPEDEHAWDVDDPFLLGPDELVAPVYEAGARTRQMFLPVGVGWLDPVNGHVREGGTTLQGGRPAGARSRLRP